MSFARENHNQPTFCRSMKMSHWLQFLRTWVLFKGKHVRIFSFVLFLPQQSVLLLRWVMSAVPLNLMCLPNLNYLFLWMSHSLGKISFFISCNYNAFSCLYTEILNIRKPILIYINYTHLLVNVSTERWSKEGICRQKNASENSFHYYFPSIIVPLLLFHD